MNVDRSGRKLPSSSYAGRAWENCMTLETVREESTRQAGKGRLYGGIGFVIVMGVVALTKFGGGILPNSAVGTVRNGVLTDY